MISPRFVHSISLREIQIPKLIINACLESQDWYSRARKQIYLLWLIDDYCGVDVCANGWVFRFRYLSSRFEFEILTGRGGEARICKCSRGMLRRCPWCRAWLAASSRSKIGTINTLLFRSRSEMPATLSGVSLENRSNHRKLFYFTIFRRKNTIYRAINALKMFLDEFFFRNIQSNFHWYTQRLLRYLAQITIFISFVAVCSIGFGRIPVENTHKWCLWGWITCENIFSQMSYRFNENQSTQCHRCELAFAWLAMEFGGELL